MVKLPEYLASINYHNPTDPSNSLFHFTNQTKLNMFEWLKTQPEQLANFSAYQAAATKIQEKSLKSSISSLFPVQEGVNILSEHEDPALEILLVDVGGGRGEILEEVRVQRPDLKGRMVVEDLPEVVEGRKPANGIEIMPFNFFDPQPIKGR